MEINHDTDDFLTELWAVRERYMDQRNTLSPTFGTGHCEY